VVRAGAEEGDAGRILSHAIGSSQRLRIEAACVDTWEPFGLSMEEWAPQCRIVCDKLHIMQHANAAVNEVFPPRSSAKAKECARS
jgi:transposase